MSIQVHRVFFIHAVMMQLKSHIVFEIWENESL